MSDRFETKIVEVQFVIARSKHKGEPELEALGREGWVIRASSAHPNTKMTMLVFLQRPIP